MTGKPFSENNPGQLSLLARGMRLLSTGLFLLVCLLVALGVSFWKSLPDLSQLENPQDTITMTVRDWQGDTHPYILGPQNPDWTPLEDLPEHLPWAVIVAEDAMFYKHRGIDLDAIREALLYDWQKQRMARGASTITQQLAKNLFLSRDKKLSRKLREAVIAWQLENRLSKERILELYLNMVELGPMVHSIAAGARYHFDKPVAQLSAAESAFLAAILPGPRVAFNPRKRPERVAERAKTLVHYMQLRRVLEEPQTEAARLEIDIIAGIAPEPLPPSEAIPFPSHLPLAQGERPEWHLPLTAS